MSQFKRTNDGLAEVTKELEALTVSKDSAPQRKLNLEQLSQRVEALRINTDKFVAKADAGERDVNKKIYGKAMVAKVRELDIALKNVEGKLEDMKGTVDEEWKEWEAEEKKRLDMEKLEKERKEKERVEKERKDKEERERIEKEEEEKRLAILERERAEKERLMLEKKKKDEEERKMKEMEEAAKKKQEAEEERKRLELEKEKEAQKEKEEAESAKASGTVSGAGMTVRTPGGETIKVPGISVDSSVGELKAAIERQCSIPTAAQRLIFAGRMLNAKDSKLSKHSVEPDSVIHLAAGAYTPRVRQRVPLVAPGSVCHLSRGAEELQDILESCGKNRLAVVDWSAPWCGPCRHIAPAFERLAGNFRNVTFVSIDTEASEANTALARSAQIQAYPTFHFYLNMQRAHEFAGANISKVERTITQYIDAARAAGMNVGETGAAISASASAASAPASGAGSNSSTSPSRPRALQAQVVRALQFLKANCQGSEFMEAVRTLLTFVRNVADHPNEAKYRKVRTANPAFQARIASKRGGTECMLAFGFEAKHENGSEFLVLSEENSRNPELVIVKNQLQEALNVLNSGNTGARTPNGRANTRAGEGGPRFGAGPFADVPLAGFGNVPPGQVDPMTLYDDPEFAAIANEMVANPEAVQAAARIQEMVERGDPNAMAAIREDPALRRLQDNLIANPQLMQRMTGMMHQMGGQMRGTNTRPPSAGRDRGMGEAGENVRVPSAPSSEMEEEQMLQQAIQLSMQQEMESTEIPSENSGAGPGEGQKTKSKKDGNDGAGTS